MSDDHVAMTKLIVVHKKKITKKIKIFIIHSSLQDKVVARHKSITDSLVAFIMDNIHDMWIHLSWHDI